MHQNIFVTLLHSDCWYETAAVVKYSKIYKYIKQYFYIDNSGTVLDFIYFSSFFQFYDNSSVIILSDPQVINLHPLLGYLIVFCQSLILITTMVEGNRSTLQLQGTHSIHRVMNWNMYAMK